MSEMERSLQNDVASTLPSAAVPQPGLGGPRKFRITLRHRIEKATSTAMVGIDLVLVAAQS